jgi:lysophospholipase L1-like esterase
MAGAVLFWGRPPSPVSFLTVSSKLIRWLLLFPLFLLLAVELILWIFVRTPLEPLKKIDLSNDLPGLKKDVRLSVDRHLARYLDNESGSKPSGTVRILCVGGSATFGLFQNAEDTWWGQMGRQLQAKGLKVQVAGWGQDRQGIVASTPIAAALMEEWLPDVVIVNFGFDDVVGQPLEFRYQPEKARGLPGAGRTAGWKQAILKVSQIARMGRRIARSNEAAAIQDKIGRTDYWKKTFTDMRKQVNTTATTALPERDATHDPLLEFMDGWKVMQDLCQRYGAALIVTGEPSLHDSTNNLSQQENLTALIPIKAAGGPEAKAVRPDPAWVERQMSRYADAAESFAKSASLPWLNLNGRVPRDLEHFFGDVILTDKGAAVMAQELLPVVEPVVKTKVK